MNCLHELGASLAALRRRPILLIGDGWAQLTIAELGTVPPLLRELGKAACAANPGAASRPTKGRESADPVGT
ncbi:hypothetical protein [Caballeronia arvi]|uniref:hypothetical protein n=1 Tax=Caballeronia arvi TaxID=1777135 RepID=UPI0007729F8B|nr:hypothetical protein [Caballeronia arvi]